MLLAVDVGNSYTSLGVFEGTQLRCELHLSTRRNWTRDELAVGISQVLGLRGLSFENVDEAAVACVVPPVLAPLADALERYTSVVPLVIGPGVKTGMPVRYDPPQDVGADRIVSAVAAYDRYGRDKGVGVIVVDFGTATTFDVVSPKPEYLGGVIAPGVGISADALFARAAKLPRVDVARPDTVVGRSTVASIQSGLVYGYASLVEGMLRRIRSEVEWDAVVVGTGGFARLAADEASGIEHVDDSLMLEGLRLIHERNRGKP
jgi:type III pantothenate kinase